MLTPHMNSIPGELRAVPRWVTHRDKAPFNPTAVNSKASVTDPGTWGSFAQAEAAYSEGDRDGVGFVLAGDGVVGIDLDHVVDDGVPAPDALALLAAVGAEYVELSPSGTGLHGWGYWSEAFPGRRGRLDGLSVEVYSRERYLTVTGHPLPGKDGPLVPLNLAPVFEGLSAQRSAPPTEEAQKMTEENGSHLLLSSVGIPPGCLPTREGERNSCLFTLARYVKGKRPDATREELRAIAQEWHRLALPVIGTKDFSVTFTDFLRGWASVRQPHGATLKNIIDAIDFSAPLPAGIDALGYGAAGNRLVRICAALQAHEGDAPFFISARQAGELVGLHFTDASKVLAALCSDGVLVLVQRGAGKVASRYRWAW